MALPYEEKTGKLIDTWIRLKRRFDGYQKSITDYVNIELSERSGLSGRQIERMRRFDGFPEDKSMSKLIEAIPDLASLDFSTFTERLLLPFSVVELAQQRIPDPPKGQFNTIVIVSGWNPPLGITQNAIAEATTQNINQSFKYIFLYPELKTCPEDLLKENDSTPEKLIHGWIDRFRQECEGLYFRSAQQNSSSRQESIERLQEFWKLTGEGIKAIYTKKPTNFWFLLPSDYVVLYNPDKAPGSEFMRYGVFKVNGSFINLSTEIIEKEDIDSDFTNQSSGWLYLQKEKYEDLAAMIREFL